MKTFRSRAGRFGGNIRRRVIVPLLLLVSMTITWRALGDPECQAPAITSQPVSQTNYYGDTVTFTVAADGSQPLAYQWYFNGSPAANLTDSTLTLHNVPLTYAGDYFVVVTNACGAVTSSVATLSVVPIPPVITIQPQSRTNSVGSTATFIVTATGSPSLLYQWYFNGTPLSGKTASTLALPNVQFTNSGDYTVVVTHSAGSVTSAVATLTVILQPPSISVQPTNQTTYVGSNVTFTVGASGSTPLLYWWFFNQSLIALRLGPTLVLANVQLTNAGTYYVVITNAGGSVTSSNAVLTVLPFPPPAISIQPRSQTNYSGANVTFTVAANGIAPLGYQWYFNESPLPGQTNATLLLSNVQFANAGTYFVIVTNSGGNVASSNAVLTVLAFPPPVISGQPRSQTNYSGANTTFTVAANSIAPLSYQWYFNESPLPGQTNATLLLSNVQLANAGTYFVIVTNIGGNVASSNAVLTVLPAPSCAPITNGLVSWWRGEGDTKDNWDSNDGSVTAKFTFGKVGLAFGSPIIQVSDSLSLQFTNALTIEAWVNPTAVPSLTLQTIVSKFDYPVISKTALQSSYFLGITNGRVMLILSPNGSPLTNTTLAATQVLPTNQWSFLVATYDGAAMRLYINGVLSAQTNYSKGIFPGTANLGIGATPYNADFVYPFNGALDEVTLYNRALSAEEIQTIYNADFVGKCFVPPTISVQPQSQAVPVGEDVKFTVSIRGSRPLKYQWRYTNPSAVPPDPINITGATNATLVLEKVQSNQAGLLYSVFVSNSAGSVVSSDATLSLLPAPTCTPTSDGLISWWPMDSGSPGPIQPNPLGDTMNANNIVSFSGQYTSGKVARALSFDGKGNAAGMNSSASLNFGSNADFSIEMWVKASPANSSTLNVPLVDKRGGPLFSSLGGYSLLLNQGRLAFVLATTTFDTNKQNSSTFISSGPDLRDNMFHHVAVALRRDATNGGNLYVDGQAVLTFDPTTRNGSLSSSSPFVIGAPITLSSNSYFAGLIDELAIYSRALSADEILAIRTAGAVGKCKVRPTILDQPNDAVATFGSNVTFTVRAAGTPLLRYQWYGNGVQISGATNASYAFTASSSASNFVRVVNLFGSVNSRSVTLTVYPPPVAFDQSVTLNEDTPASILLAGTNFNNATLTYSIVTLPSVGNLSGVSPNLVYAPAQCFVGPDSFTFKVNDGLADSAPATVSINVIRVNNTITAQSQSLVVNMNNTLAITLVAANTASYPLTFNVGAPANGKLSGTPPNLVYTPDLDYYGPDSFTFSASDCQTNSEVASVSVKVNHPPLAAITVSPLSVIPGVTNLLVISTNNVKTAVVLDGSKSSDPDGDPLTYLWSQGTNVISTDVAVTNVLPLDSYTFDLAVNDGLATNSANVTVEVLSAANAVYLLIGDVQDAKISQRSETPLVASLEAAAAAFDRGSVMAGLNQLAAFQHKVRAQIAPRYPALAESWINGAQAIIDTFTGSH